MSDEIQLQSAGTLRALRTLLEDFNPTGGLNVAYLLSFEGFPLDFTISREKETFAHEFRTFSAKHGTKVFQISNFEYAFMAANDAEDKKGIGNDLRIMVLGIIQNLYPSLFQETDQSRIVRKLQLPDRLAGFRDYISQRQKAVLAAASGGTTKHKLCEADITGLKTALSKKSPLEIAQNFISRQSIYLVKEGEPLKPVAEEFFISMEAVRKHILKETDFRGNAALFNHLTLYLDKILLGSLVHVMDRKLPISINLNVESVFSNAFKSFMDSMGGDDLNLIQIEFRQADILQHLRQYHLVGKVLAEHQGSTVIDAVFPDTLGLVRMERLSPAFVKIFWQDDSDIALSDHRDDIRDIVKAGIFPVLSRVEDEAGYKAGLDLGIKLFQGFYFDALAETNQ